MDLFIKKGTTWIFTKKLSGVTERVEGKVRKKGLMTMKNHATLNMFKKFEYMETIILQKLRVKKLI